MQLNDNLPVGSVIIWAGDSNDLPSNWKVCNGKQLKKTDYADLYSILGTYCDNDNGYQADFFSLPDLRGVFLRGVNDKRTGPYCDKNSTNRFRLKGNSGLSPDSPGSFQQDAIGRHHHQIVQQSWGGIYTTPEGVSGNTSSKDGNFDSSQLSTGIDRNNVPLVIADFGGEETHPVNAYVYFIIKIKQDL